ncbi:MAG: hypothetical protein WDW38_000156 [Sanguina aurantia]
MTPAQAGTSTLASVTALQHLHSLHASLGLGGDKPPTSSHHLAHQSSSSSSGDRDSDQRSSSSSSGERDSGQRSSSSSSSSGGERDSGPGSSSSSSASSIPALVQGPSGAEVRAAEEVRCLLATCTQSLISGWLSKQDILLPHASLTDLSRLSQALKQQQHRSGDSEMTHALVTVIMRKATSLLRTNTPRAGQALPGVDATHVQLQGDFAAVTALLLGVAHWRRTDTGPLCTAAAQWVTAAQACGTLPMGPSQVSSLAHAFGAMRSRQPLLFGRMVTATLPHMQAYPSTPPPPTLQPLAGKRSLPPSISPGSINSSSGSSSGSSSSGGSSSHGGSSSGSSGSSGSSSGGGSSSATPCAVSVSDSEVELDSSRCDDSQLLPLHLTHLIWGCASAQHYDERLMVGAVPVLLRMMPLSTAAVQPLPTLDTSSLCSAAAAAAAATIASTADGSATASTATTAAASPHLQDAGDECHSLPHRNSCNATASGTPHSQAHSQPHTPSPPHASSLPPVLNAAATHANHARLGSPPPVLNAAVLGMGAKQLSDVAWAYSQLAFFDAALLRGIAEGLMAIPEPALPIGTLLKAAFSLAKVNLPAACSPRYAGHTCTPSASRDAAGATHSAAAVASSHSSVRDIGQVGRGAETALSDAGQLADFRALESSFVCWLAQRVGRADVLKQLSRKQLSNLALTLSMLTPLNFPHSGIESMDSGRQLLQSRCIPPPNAHASSRGSHTEATAGEAAMHAGMAALQVVLLEVAQRFDAGQWESVVAQEAQQLLQAHTVLQQQQQLSQLSEPLGIPLLCVGSGCDMPLSQAVLDALWGVVGADRSALSRLGNVSFLEEEVRGTLDGLRDGRARHLQRQRQQQHQGGGSLEAEAGGSSSHRRDRLRYFPPMVGGEIVYIHKERPVATSPVAVGRSPSRASLSHFPVQPPAASSRSSTHSTIGTESQSGSRLSNNSSGSCDGRASGNAGGSSSSSSSSSTGSSAAQSLVTMDLLVEFLDGRSVGVQVEGPKHFSRNNGRQVPNGATHLRDRLTMLGGQQRCVSVPYFEWGALDGERERQRYMAEKLRLALLN